MASTNKTANYELSQYVGTDKPTYLSDYNGDMYKIDAQMKVNADNIATAISSASSASSTATSALSTAQSAESTANSASSTATSASTTAGYAQTTANSALSTATSAQNTANQVASDLTTLSGTVTSLSGTVTSNTSAITALNTYSTTETVIGTWINGKPLYRKVIHGNDTSTDIATGITNVDEIVNMSCIIEQNTTNDWRILPWTFSYGSTAGGPEWTGGYYFKASTGEISFQLGTQLGQDHDVIVIIEYTKTTDSANE